MDADRFDIDDNTPAPMEVDHLHIEEYEEDSTSVVPATPSSLEEPVAGTSRSAIEERPEQDDVDGGNDNQVVIDEEDRDGNEERMDDQNKTDNHENEDEESVLFEEKYEESVLFEEEYEDLRDNELSVSGSESDDDDKGETLEENSEDEEDDEEDEAEDQDRDAEIDDDAEDKENDPEDDNEDDEEIQVLHESDTGKEQEDDKVLHLPISKVKKLMKADNPITLFGKDAVAALIISTEMFISLLAQQSQRMAASNKKRTVQLNHLKAALTSNPLYDFLEGTLPEYDI